MPTYVYETVDDSEPRHLFEFRQSMNDKPLTRHPETGKPIRRIISGGFGFMSQRTTRQHAPAPPKRGGGCGGGCACHG